MNTTLQNNFSSKTRSGAKFKWDKDDLLIINTYENSKGRKVPTYAEVFNVDKDQKVIFEMTRLYKLNDIFPEITEKMISVAMLDSICESMTGANVEPDGYDNYGMPSVLMAAGIV